MALFETQNITELKELNVKIQRSWWERIGSFLWFGLKGILLVFIVASVFAGSQMSNDDSSVNYEKIYIDSYHRPLSTPMSLHEVAIIDINGVIVNSSGDTITGDPIAYAEDIISLMASAAEDENVVAILLRVDSPGGEVLATEKITRMVELIKDNPVSPKPVFVLMESIAASGGYYLATPATKIYAYPETLLGNIGVRIDIPNISGLMEKVGVQMQSVTSGDMKTIGSPFREMTEEEKTVFQDLIDESYKQFVTRVSKGRNIPYETALELADGRIYSGIQAEKNGLIDETVESFPVLALSISQELRGKDIQFVYFQHSLSAFDKFFMRLTTSVSPLTNAFSQAQQTRFLMQ